MPDVTLIDVLTGARNTWGTSAGLLAIVPLARVYAFGVPEGVAYPNCVVETDDVSAYFGGTEYYSGTTYQRTSKIGLSVYALMGTVDWATLARLLGDTFGWAVGSPAGAWVVPNAVAVISAMPEVDSFTRTGERIDGLEVLKYKAEFTVKIQADRG